MITGKALAKAVRVTENTITNALAGKAILHSNASRISMILNMEIKDIFDVVSISGGLHWLN
jgi:plasmid maintenance system antidote protein VapI